MTSNLHRLLALALLIVLGMGVYWLINDLWLGRYSYYRDNAEQFQDRLQRYRGIVASRPALEDRLNQIGQDSTADDYYLQSAAPNLAATEMQQQIKAIVEGNGGRLASTQILPTSVESGFTRVAIRVQLLVTETDALQKTLYALESFKPLLFVDNVQMRARQVRKRVPVANAGRNRNARDRRARRRQPRQIKTETQLTAQFELAGYIRKGGA